MLVGEDVELLSLLKCKQQEEYDARTSICKLHQPADRLYVVSQGLVMSCLPKQEEDEFESLCLYGPNDFFGLEALGDAAARYERDVVAVTRDTAVMSWSREELERLRTVEYFNFLNDPSKRPQLDKAIVQLIMVEKQRDQQRIAMLNKPFARRRLTLALLELASRFGELKSDGSVAIPFVIHAHVAGMIAARRNFVTHQLQDFKREGILAKTSRPILISNMELLRQEVSRMYAVPA